MAAKYKLFFQVIQGTLSAKNLVTELRSRKLKVAKASLYSDGTTGVISFQREQDRQTILGTKYLDIKGAKILVSKDNPRNTQTAEGANNRNPNSPPAGSEHPDEGESHSSEFLNPYHFVDVRGYTPRYGIVPHDRYSHHCGRIEAELELVTPGFIPDPEETYYIISDDTVILEDHDRGDSKPIHSTIEAWMKQRGKRDGDLPLQVHFASKCQFWNPIEPGKYLWAINELPTEDFLTGDIHKNEEGFYFIKTREPSRWAHKEMHFFKLNGKHTLPSTSLRGMLRNIIETLSNSCFTGFDEDQGEEYLFHRLEPRSSRGLQPVVLKKVDGQWGIVCVDQAKVLSPHLFNRIGVSGENTLAAYWNKAGKYYEKISVRGKFDANSYNDCTGLHKYELPRPIGKNYRGEIQEICSEAEIETRDFAVTKIKGHPLTHPENQYNKTFPYVDSVVNIPKLWAIVRQLRIPRRRGTRFFLSYKIKVIADDKKALEEPLKDFESNNRKEPNGDRVTYAICEIRIKTAFHIDTKTQERAFFIFGEKNFEKAIEDRIREGEFYPLDDYVINQFKSLLRRRKANAEKVFPDNIGLNKKIAGALPDDIKDGMLAYFHQLDGYLTYTTVPHAPYISTIHCLLSKQDKLPCKNIDWLCPACQMFGTVVPKEKGAPRTAKKPSGYRGKVVVSNGELMSKAQVIGPVTLKPLSSPKPTFYPFYIMGAS